MTHKMATRIMVESVASQWFGFDKNSSLGLGPSQAIYAMWPRSKRIMKPNKQK